MQLHEVADFVVLVSLAVAAHRLAVVRMGQAHAELVIPTRLRLRDLTDVLAAVASIRR